MFSGPLGGIPLLVEGGWLDQPHFTLRILEACIEGERLFEDFLKQINEQAIRSAITSGNIQDSFDASK